MHKPYFRSSMLRILFTLSLYLLLCPAKAQFRDSFTDGDFTANPQWISNTNDFIVDNAQLRSNKTEAATFGISTALGSNISIWNFSFKLSFNPSSANYIHVFLSADSLAENAQNGYYVKIGNTKDEISLYKLTNGVSTEIISGTDDLLNQSSSAFDVSVVYKNDSWFLYQKASGTVSFTKEGAYKEVGFTPLNYFGVLVTQSKSNAGKHYFDNFYVGQPPIDNVAPQIFNAQVKDNTTLTLNLTENIKAVTPAQLLVNGVSAQSINASFPASSLEANFGSAFPKNKNLRIELKNFEDLAGNATALSTYNLFNAQFDSAVYGDLIITEIMSNPTPVVSGLPDYEYVEIYNRSNKYIDLSQYAFSDASSGVTLPDSSLAPYSFAILSRQTDNMSAYGRWIPLTTMPSLNNDGDDLSIKSASGFLIHRVKYSSSWHQNGLKAQGGWSLEMIDTQKFCLGSNNWSSNNGSGGSPGNLNSINATIQISTQFKIENRYVLGNDIHIVFSENLANCSTCNAGILDPQTNLDIASLTGNELVLKSPINLMPDVIYEVDLSGFLSCDGRPLSTKKINIGAATDKEIKAWDLLINEVLFNPKGYDDDFVEIYNGSNKIIDLQYIFIANGNDDGSIKDAFQISTVPLPILPQQYLAITTSKLNTTTHFSPLEHAQITEVSKLPTYSNDKGWVILVSNTNAILHSFFYEDDMHFELLTDDDGVSLERSHLDSVNENWSSASYLSNYGTPGYVNSQYRPSSASSSFASLLSKTVSPDGDGWEDKLIIKINSKNLPAAINLTIYNEFGQLIKKVNSQQVLGYGDLIEWDGIYRNGLAPMGNYIALVEAVGANGSIEKAKLVFSILKRQ